MVSQTRFEMISQRLVASDPKFYAENRSANKEPVASTQAKILIGLKSISHGVCPATLPTISRCPKLLRFSVVRN
jgi:hypothetical protein